MSQVAGFRLNDAPRGHSRSALLQQWGTAVGGGALAIYGLTRRSALGYVLATGGGALTYYAVRSDPNRRFTAHSTIQLNCSPEEAYRFWRDFENLPRFMRHVDLVNVIDNLHSRWIALGPMGKAITWVAEITDERPNELIAWRSVPGSDVHINGRVRFQRATAGRGTIIDAAIEYLPPAGALGRTMAKLLGKDPSFLMHQDLRRLKALIEAGELPTIEGQSHGPRDRITAVIRVIDPDRPIRRDSRLTEVLSAERRVS
jgi:uncharacterized membrane protein